MPLAYVLAADQIPVAHHERATPWNIAFLLHWLLLWSSLCQRLLHRPLDSQLMRASVSADVCYVSDLDKRLMQPLHMGCCCRIA